jgi:gas vesicle protein
MMHGTLEVKRDVFAEASAFVKPDWMDTLLPAEMSEAQLKEYDAYMSKLKALQEEQAMYRKALEQEMKRLKNEVTELCKAFDEKLAELASLKVLVHREIFAHEIYISRLALNMAKTEQTMRFLRKSEDQVQSLRADRAELRRGMELLSSQLEDMKTKIGAIQEDERQMDKTFRRDLQNLCNNNFDQDALKVLTQLYRQRTYPRGGGAAAEEFGDLPITVLSKYNSSTNDVKNKKLKASKGGASAGGGGGKDSALGPMQQAAQALRTSDEPSYKDKDPYYEALLELEKQKVQQEAQVPILSQLSIELDCPEGFDIDQFSWSKLMELRTARIEKEIEGKVLSIEFSKLKQKLERLDCEEQVLAGCISDIRTSREGAISGLRDLESNLDLVVRLRQGQDEVDRDAVVTDYSDALLLPITVLSKYNSRIKELGKEKISVLSKIKLFRRKINLIDWEAKHHGMEARHYEAYLTDLQLFRVTRELQRVIRDGSDATQTKVQLFSVFPRHTVAGC